MGSARGVPPCEITLIYQLVAGTHTFFCRDVPGLAICGFDLQDAFHSAVSSLAGHVGMIWNVEVQYQPEVTFAQFEAKLNKLGRTAALGMPVRGRIEHVIARV